MCGSQKTGITVADFPSKDEKMPIKGSLTLGGQDGVTDVKAGVNFIINTKVTPRCYQDGENLEIQTIPWDAESPEDRESLAIVDEELSKYDW